MGHQWLGHRQIALPLEKQTGAESPLVSNAAGVGFRADEVVYLESRQERGDGGARHPGGTSNFLTRTNNLRGKKYASDHLPLLCELNF